MIHSKQTLELKQSRVRPRWASVETNQNRVVVTCSDCNFVEAERVGRLYTLLLGVMTPQVETVELDLRKVNGADTKLIAALISAVRSAQNCGVRLIIRASPHMRQLIQVCRLDEIIETC